MKGIVDHHPYVGELRVYQPGTGTHAKNELWLLWGK